MWGWYNAGAGVTGTTNVTGWADQSGGGNDLILANGSLPLELVPSAINALPAIKSKGSGVNYGAFLSSANVPALTTGSVYIVAKQSAADAALQSGQGKFVVSNGNFIIQRFDALQADSFVAMTSAGSQTPMIAATNDVFYTAALILSSNAMDFSLNAGTSVLGTSSDPLAASALSVFGRGDKQIAEIIIYTATHNSTQQGQVKNYLRTKYNHY